MKFFDKFKIIYSSIISLAIYLALTEFQPLTLICSNNLCLFYSWLIFIGAVIILAFVILTLIYVTEKLIHKK
jgi:hypothetical protein